MRVALLSAELIQVPPTCEQTANVSGRDDVLGPPPA
jgi:hypothetical protein